MQKEQKNEISQLEKRVAEMRLKHNEAVQKLKAQFLEEKNNFEQESEAKLRQLRKESKKVILLLPTIKLFIEIIIIMGFFHS